jgi:membrane-bound serine protease (ClpP class)
MLLAVAGMLLIGPRADGQAAGPRILVSTIDGPITPVVADHIEEGTARAAATAFDAYLVELDTPGGLDTSMRDIVQSLLGSDVPVIVYVAPQGARAASAGAIIVLASHVAAMAPGTTIGAATPVDLQGGEISDKILNDATSYTRALAELRGRNEDFAADIVVEGRSVTATEAVEIGAVELIAPSRSDLLTALDGRQVALDESTDVTLRTAGAELVPHDLLWSRAVLQWLADPNLAFLFISLGTLAIVYEVANPGVGFGAIGGAILLLLGFFSLAVLPVSAVGILLLVLALALFVTELFVPGVGVFAAGGTTALVLAGLFLFRGSIGVDLFVLVPTALVAGGGALLVGRLVWRSRHIPRTTGAAGMIGARGTIRVADGRRGQAFVNGALWNTRAEAPLRLGEPIRVIGIDGLDLIVEPEEET